MAIDYTKKPKQAAPPPPPPPPTTPPVSTAPPVPGAPAPVASAPVSLSKVTLTKAAPTVSLDKQDAGGVMRVNLNWNARPAGSGGGIFRKASGGQIDLDLGCLYEFSDGSKGVVQALGNAFRDKNTFSADPVCWLDGDDRSGTNAAGENLFVNLAFLPRIKRIMVFAFIYEGVPNWAAANAVVTLFPPSGPQVEVHLDENGAGSGMCGIAMLENVGGRLDVRREIRYVKGHSALDEAYGWGMRWTAGRK